MSSVPVSDEGSFLAGTVELVPSLRGKNKAKYLDRTFTLESSSGHRYRWRCDQRQCKSRLITDFYGDEHMVYKFRDHDEDTHRLVENKRKNRLEITYKQKPVKIGDYRYVSEKRIGGLIFWRCVYVSCSGRCRTHDGHLVSGPSEHLCSAPAKKVQPDTDDQCGNIPGGAARASDGCTLPDCRDDREGSSRDVVSHEQQEEELDQPHRKKPKQQLEKGDQGRQSEQKQQPDDRSRSPATNSEPITVSNVALNLKSLIKSEPPSPVPSNKDTCVDDVIEDDRSTVTNSSCDDESRNIDEHGLEESRECRGHVGSDNGGEEPAREGAGGAEEDEHCGRIGVNEGHDDRPSKMADRFGRVGSNRTISTGQRVAEWIRTARGTCSSREKELREDVLLQMRRLLESETELLKEMRNTEALRQRMLARRCEALGIETAPGASRWRRPMHFVEFKE